MLDSKYAVAFVIRNESGQPLIVQRPLTDDNLPGYWGLPAGMINTDETPEQAVVRSAKDKLGVDVHVTTTVGKGEIERSSYTLHMTEFEVEILNGIPVAPQPVLGITQYIQWRWGTAEDLKPAAVAGSLCSRLYLQASGLTWN